MKLTGIVNDGVKGRRGSRKITPITLITGPNGEGKTTHLLAIAEAVNGSGRWPWAADGQRAAVALQFEGGEGDRDGWVTLQRQFTPDHNVTVSPGPTGVKKVKAWVGERLGCGSLDVMDFLHLTPGDREAALLSVVPAMPDDWISRDRLRELVGDLIADELEEHAGQIPGPGSAPAAWAKWLGGAAKAVRSRKLAHGRLVKTMEGELAHAALSDSDAELVGTLAEAQAAKAAADDELREVRTRMALLEELGGSTDDARTQHTQLGREIAELVDALERFTGEDVPVHVDDRSKLNAWIADAEAKQKQAAEIQRQHLAAARHLADMRRVEAAAREAMQLADEAVQAYKREAPCPECGQPVDTECDGYGRALSRHDEATVRWETAQADVEHAERSANDLAVALAEVRVPAAELVGQRKQKAAELAQAIRDAADRDRRKRQGMEAERDGKIRARASLEAALERAPQQLDPKLAAAELAAAEKQVEEAAAILQRHNRAQAREEERADKLRRKMDAAERRDAFTEALDRVLELRAELTRQTAGKVLDDAQDLFGRVFTGQLVTTDDPKGGARLALERDGVTIPAEAWSDSETLIAGLAFHLTMQRATGAKWKVALVDNVDRLTPDTLAKLIGGLIDWHGMGAFDNVIMAGALPYDVPVGAMGPLVSVVAVAA